MTQLRGRPVTKSVRLSREESTLLAEVSTREHLAEGTLLRKWVLDALAHSRLELAVADYTSAELNLVEAATRAEVNGDRMLAGHDAQLETAVDLMIKAIANRPGGLPLPPPLAPPYPESGMVRPRP